LTLPPQLFEQLAALFAAELAPRIAAELADREPQGEVEPWCLLTLAEAAERLGRSERWVRQRKDAIGHVRLDGGALAFRLEDLQTFAAERVVGGRPLAERSGSALRVA
jgi:hypothetical protein